MRKVLFLDFDGVLHSEKCAQCFSKLKLFELYLTKMPMVEIVISSSWREAHPFAELKLIFDASLQSRIIGVTPSLDCGYEWGGRQREIEVFLANNSLDKDSASWVALDDISYFFDNDCTYLILVDPNIGFSDKEGKYLLQWYNDAEYNLVA